MGKEAIYSMRQSLIQHNYLVTLGIVRPIQSVKYHLDWEAAIDWSEGQLEARVEAVPQQRRERNDTKRLAQVLGEHRDDGLPRKTTTLFAYKEVDFSNSIIYGCWRHAV